MEIHLLVYLHHNL